MASSRESDDRWRRVREVFALAMETAPAQRTALLDSECANDTALRGEIEQLLESDSQAQGFLDEPAGRLWLDRTQTLTSDGSPAACRELLPAGHTLAGRYRILSLIGQGGMGAVYRAQDALVGGEVAVKVLDRHRTMSAARLEAFRREVKLARRVSHPNVCRVHDMGEDAGSVFLTMEYVEGESLANRLRQVQLPALPWVERVLRDIGRGLAAAHAAGVVHRDLKPENVLLRAGTDEAVVVDFGIASQVVENDDLDELDGWIVGTRGYMSPEQLAGKPVDARSDLYALGTLAQQIATGQHPGAIPCRDDADEPDARAARPLPPELASFVSACRRTDPEERPQDVPAALALLESPPSQGEAPRAGRRGRHWPRWALLGAGLLALTAAGVGLRRPWALARHAPSAVVLGPFDSSRLGAEDGWEADALRSLIRNELIDGWGMKARVESQPARSPDTAVIVGRVWREEGRPQLTVQTGLGWFRRERRVPGSSLRELAQSAARLIVEEGVPEAERHPTVGDLRAVGTRDPEAWRLLRRARRAARLQRWGEVREMTRDAVRRDPTFALGWLEQALTFNDADSGRDGLLGEALAQAARARGLDQFSAALLEFGRHWRANDLAGQARIIQGIDGLTLGDQDLLYARTRVALVRILRGDIAGGVAQMEWIAEKWPDDAASHAFLADYHLAAAEAARFEDDAGGSLALALRHAQRAVELAPEEIGARTTLARALLDSGHTQAAKAEVDRAARAEHEDKQAARTGIESRSSVFALHMALADWDEAAADARRMLVGRHANRLYGQYLLALLDLNRGDYSRGFQGLQLAAEQEEGLGQTIAAAEHEWEICRHAFRLARYEDALQACDWARQRSQPSLNPEDVWRAEAAGAVVRLAAAQLLSGRERQRGLQVSSSAIASMRRDNPHRQQLELLQRHGLRDWAGVVEAYQRVAGRPEAVATACYAAEALERLGRNEEAQRLDAWFAVHPNAWLYPNRRIRPKPTSRLQPSTSLAAPTR